MMDGMSLASTMGTCDASYSHCSTEAFNHLSPLHTKLLALENSLAEPTHILNHHVSTSLFPGVTSFQKFIVSTRQEGKKEITGVGSHVAFV